MSFTDKFGTTESTFGNIGFALGTTYNGQVYDKTVPQTLTLTQSIHLSLTRFVSQTLTLSQSASTSGTSNTSGSHTLTFSQLAEETVSYARSLAQSLSLSQAAIVSATFDREISQSLTLSDRASVSIPLTVEQTLTLTSDVNVETAKGINEALTLTDLAEYTQAYAENLSNTLTLSHTQALSKSVGREVAQVWGPSQNARGTLSFARTTPQSLTLTSDLVRDRTDEDRPQSLSITQTAGQQKIITRSVQHTLALGSAVRQPSTYININVTQTLVFKQQHARPTGIPSYPVVNIPSGYVVHLVSPRPGYVNPSCDPYRGDTTILEIPGLSVILPTAEFDDSQSFNGRVSIKRAMNGRRRIYHRKMGIAQKLKYDFVIDRRKAIELRQFLIRANSIPVKLTNWKGEVWQVLITNSPLTFTEEKYWGPQPGGNKSSITLEFEGARIN